MKLRCNAAPGSFLMAIFGLFVLSACNSSPAIPLAAQPTRVRAWVPPTPFPPMQYPTAVVTPALPPALDAEAPLINSPLGQLQYAPVQGKIQQQLLEIEKDTQKVRGLEPTGDVKEQFISRDQLRDNMLALQRKYETREQARESETQLWLLRLIKQQSIGLYQLEAGMLSDQLAGYYDPSQKELFVLSGSTDLDPQAKTTLAHEYVHSLQDQHFDLQKLLGASPDNTDRLLGVKSLIEGDATLSQVLYADQYLSANEFNRLVEDSLSYNVPASQVPDIFEEELHFPYTYGEAFVKYLYTRGGFDTVNKALADPPISTEQIMHPEKYLAPHRDDPLPVGVPPLTDTLGSGWSYRFTESIGEFELGVMLKDNGVLDPSDAVAGWGGGQADLYENGANSLVILGTRWDTQRDAGEFEMALRQSLSLVGRYGPNWTDGIRYFNIKRVRDKVYYVGSTDPEALKRALGEVK